MSRKRPWKEPQEIRLAPDGFEAFVGERRELRVEWSKVRGIAGFKQDIFTVDLICLGFRDSEGHDYAVVSEDFENYDALTQEIERRYPDHDPQWWGKVLQPPFSTCWTVIWGDAPEPADCPSCKADISGCVQDHCPRCGVSLATRPCPRCRGRGAFYGTWAKWLGALVVVGGVVLLALTWLFPQINEPSRHLRAWGWMLAAGGAFWLFLALRDKPDPCKFCEETGWWDPRGRAARRIPPAR
jgi:hypothetical protein